MKEKWNCPKCNNSIVLHVQVEVPPVCHNKSAHTSTTYEMEKENDANRNI